MKPRARPSTSPPSSGGGEKGPDPKLKEIEVPGCEVVTGNGKFPSALHTCYLSTYAWMLNQHERLQTMERTMVLRREPEYDLG